MSSKFHRSILASRHSTATFDVDCRRFGWSNGERLRTVLAYPVTIAGLFQPGPQGIVKRMSVALRGLDRLLADELARHPLRHATQNEHPRRRGSEYL